jgi:hypothetical protein
MPHVFRRRNIVGLVAAVLLAATPWAERVSADGLPELRPKRGDVTDADRAFWSFRPVKDPQVPVVDDHGWGRTPVDRFIFASLSQRGLSPANEADRVALMRRATFDLHGLPPTPQELDAFVADPSSDAYEKLIDRLLASPRYAERWARHWLDLVRYAESDGFKQDTYRPAAWPYRDYVIQSFNDDKPYDRFVVEQIAGDELAPGDPKVMVATGYLRHGTYEYNQRDVPKQRSEILNDVTDVTGDLFLGLSVGCARCHNHKFDPITQADYYRLQAFFTPLLARDVPMATPAKQAETAAAIAVWEQKSAGVRAELAALEAPFIRESEKVAIGKFPPDMQAILAVADDQRSPLQKQLAALAYRQIHDAEENPPVKIADKDLKARHAELKKQLAAFETERPAPLQNVQVACDVGPIAPPTIIPSTTEQPVEPGCPSVLEGDTLSLPSIAPTASSTGRRTALAKWITDPTNPLTARVIVNRVWQYHFGRGLVGTSSDFGTLGERPSHPELLDWLASRFVEAKTSTGQGLGWQFKPLHRLIMTSAVYRQSALQSPSQAAQAADPDNRLLWRMTTRRLDAEQVRDAMLAVSGELSGDVGGPSVDASVARRSVYVKTIRNNRDRLLDAFDQPESFCSVADRNATTTATQALIMINGEWPLKRAKAMAARLRREATTADPGALVEAAYRLAWARSPKPDERDSALELITRTEAQASEAEPDAGLVDLCQFERVSLRGLIAHVATCHEQPNGDPRLAAS